MLSNMANQWSIEQLRDRLDELQIKEGKTEAAKHQVQEFLKNVDSNEGKLKIIDMLKTVNETVLSIQQERVKIIDLMTIRTETGAVGPPSKKMRRSLPPPTSGFKWTFDILDAYSINFKEICSLDDLFFQTPPATSDRAIRFMDACSIISHENILKVKFPADHHASWLAKHLYVNTARCFGNMEPSIDDMFFVLFDALGFNDGDLITVSRNRLNFQMSNKLVCADADLTVFNSKTVIQLILVEDKRLDPDVGIARSGEPQLVAEAIAAAMYNQRILDGNITRRAISEPPMNDSKARETITSNTLSMPDLIIFMIRVSGSNVFFYSHKFSDDLLKSIANGNKPLEHTQIQKFIVMTDNKDRRGLSLLIADDRAIIFRILDCIQQIISKL